MMWGAAALSTLVLRPFWLAIAPLLPACPFRSLTGIPCPTCGATHVALALLNGDLRAALGANPLAALAAVAFIVGGVLAPIWAFTRFPMPELAAPLPRWVRAAIVTVLLAGWAWVIVTTR